MSLGLIGQWEVLGINNTYFEMPAKKQPKFEDEEDDKDKDKFDDKDFPDDEDEPDDDVEPDDDGGVDWDSEW